MTTTPKTQRSLIRYAIWMTALTALLLWAAYLVREVLLLLYISGLLAKEHVFVLAALSGGDAVGALAAYELPKLERARSEIYIYDLAVTERWRRRGVHGGRH